MKDSLVTVYDIHIIDRSYDGILGVEFKNKFTEYTFIVYSCYLPPENSTWSNSDEFFGHMIAQLYTNSYADAVYLCGDFNCRIGNSLDIAVGIDDVKERVILDDVKASHYGEALVDFLKDVKMCTLNGRFSSANDNFTCISPRGKSVVDFVLVPHDTLQSCIDFRVDSVTDIMETYGLMSLESTHCKRPDHSLLYLKFKGGYSNKYG